SVITKKQKPFLFPWKHGWSSLFTPQTSHCPIWRGTRSSCPRFAGTSSFFTFGAVPHHRALNSSAFSNSIKQNSLRRTFAFCVSTWMIDRKSTRLNSSHVSISYAVFCLKKKKQSIKQPQRINSQPKS